MGYEDWALFFPSRNEKIAGGEETTEPKCVRSDEEDKEESSVSVPSFLFLSYPFGVSLPCGLPKYLHISLHCFKIKETFYKVVHRASSCEVLVHA